jgi:hypothetical protein
MGAQSVGELAERLASSKVVRTGERKVDETAGLWAVVTAALMVATTADQWNTTKVALTVVNWAAS